MTKKIKDIHFNNKSNELLKAPKSDYIKIDHLAFSFPLASLRHCRTAGSVKFPTRIKTGKKTYDGKPEYINVPRTSIFPEAPEIKNFKSDEVEEFQNYKAEVSQKMISFYEQTLKVWVNHVLGMQISPLSGKGFHGYKDSATLKCNGVDVGIFGIGGQRDTVYFQISGTGCKHLFNHTTPFVLHHWLSKVLSVTTLGRIDLAYDDFDNNFNCDYAHAAYKDDFFRTNPKCKSGDFGENHKFSYDSDFNKKYSQEMVTVGSRKSPIYWRIYNKKLEQLQAGKDIHLLHWYRSEVELKKWTVDALLNVTATFAGICPYAAQLDSDIGVKTKQMNCTKDKSEDAALLLAANVKHVRRSCGRALGDILEVFDGDIEKTMGLILPETTGGKFSIPPTYKHLIDKITEVKL